MTTVRFPVILVTRFIESFKLNLRKHVERKAAHTEVKSSRKCDEKNPRLCSREIDRRREISRGFINVRGDGGGARPRAVGGAK